MFYNNHGMVFDSLHLFAGAGGGILSDMSLGHRIIGAVEIEPYARKILLSRQLDGSLSKFPIWDDVKTFRINNPDTKNYIQWLQKRNRKLVICGGFPCQDISIAGKGKGISGKRSGLWMEMARIISEIRPHYIFVENTPMLITRGLDRVVGDLAEMGYNSEWGVIGAKDIGAPHKRDRIWIMGYTDDYGLFAA